jgi:hypothetical protein
VWLRDHYPIAEELNMSGPEICRRAMHELTIVEEKIIDKNGKPFYPEEYSRFKHGDAAILRQYGHNLADFLLQVFPELLASPTEKILVAPFPYMHVPTGLWPSSMVDSMPRFYFQSQSSSQP